jgi:hypothetical protein
MFCAEGIHFARVVATSAVLENLKSARAHDIESYAFISMEPIEKRTHLLADVGEIVEGNSVVKQQNDGVALLVVTDDF